MPDEPEEELSEDVKRILEERLSIADLESTVDAREALAEIRRRLKEDRTVWYTLRRFGKHPSVH